tara:strand:- start:218 stop:646 length:429 start_codon:yes stop_codon:yes gene_type:complete
MRWTTLKKWDKTPVRSNDFNLVTKFTDLGTMDGQKSILGIIVTITQDTLSTNTDVVYRLTVRYRISPNHQFQSLGELLVTNTDGYNPQGVRQYRLMLENPIKNIHNFQLQIHGLVDGDLGINDIAIVYRKYRDTAESDLDEN